MRMKLKQRVYMKSIRLLVCFFFKQYREVATWKCVGFSLKCIHLKKRVIC